ncbi:hypothetical protein HDG33_006594 [Paraburkholderia sp. Cpub6]|nr:hypothetical protein [Paraburkholderia sp. Cpub6]
MGEHFGARCENWKCQGMQGALMHRDAESAVSAWNRRAALPPSDTAQAPVDPADIEQMTPNQRRAVNKGLAALETMAGLRAAEVSLSRLALRIAAVPNESERAGRIAAMIEQGFIEGAYRHFLDHKDAAPVAPAAQKVAENTQEVARPDERAAFDLDAIETAASAATPQDIDSAESADHYDDGRHVECPACGGEGSVTLEADFLNYDGEALGVQFYGIGKAPGLAEAYFRAVKPATVLALIAEVRAARAMAPMQPLIVDGHGAVRFKQNDIVRHLLDNGGIDLNTIAALDFTDVDRQQFAQLIGYSVSGYGELSFVSDASYDRAAAGVDAAIAASTEKEDKA